MKRTLIALLAAAAATVSCQKGEIPAAGLTPADGSGLRPIVFTAEGGGLDAHVDTKATAVTSLSSFYVGCTTGSAGSETSKWNSTAFSGSTSYTGGKYWPATNPSYHFYASNAALTFAAAGTTVSPDGSVDVVTAYLASPTYASSNALTFGHIYARVGTVSISAAAGTLSNVSATLKSVATGGTYNLRTGAWTAGTKADKAVSVGSNDIYVVPGTYTLSVTYTITNGDYSATFTKTGSVTLQKGKINNISATAPNSSTAITFTVSVTAWSTASVSAGTLS